MSRTKEVYPTDQIFHLWANGRTDFARNPHGNVKTSAGIIYSYGDHFQIARWFKNQSDETCILFTRRTYSSTTSGHIWSAKAAIPSWVPVFLVRDPANYNTYGATTFADQKRELEKDCAEYIEEAKEAIIKLKRARSRAPEYIHNAQHLLSQAQKMKDFFKLRLTVPTFESLTPDKLIADAQKRYDKEQRLAALKIENAANFELWLNDERERSPQGYYQDENGSAYLRLHNGDTVETSMGAQVPLTEAMQAFRFVKLVKERGQGWHTNGIRASIGAFDIREITTEGNMTVGCHFLTWQRIEEFATKAGFFGINSADDILMAHA